MGNGVISVMKTAVSIHQASALMHTQRAFGKGQFEV